MTKQDEINAAKARIEQQRDAAALQFGFAMSSATVTVITAGTAATTPTFARRKPKWFRVTA